MATPLAQDLENSLNSYSVGIEYWEPNAGDTYTFLGHREFLQAHRGALSARQSQRMQLADAQVATLLGQNANTDSDDVEELQMIADVINGTVKKNA